MYLRVTIDNFTVSSLVRKLKQQAREQMEGRRPHLVAALRSMGDFYMELKWDFQSWGRYPKSQTNFISCQNQYFCQICQNAKKIYFD